MNLHWLDWTVMIGTLAAIVLYGVWKTRSVSSVQSYLLGDRDLPWWTIGLSVMSTQASAITFLSTPGQAYEDGMGFAQFYFGMPIAMVILCIFVLPVYYRLNVYTAYEYLEGRFDVKTRVLTAFLFLIQRGMAAGITIYAPSIILSSLFGWSLFWTNISLGGLVIFYTVAGGTKAVSVTQKQQMIIILIGMVLAALVMVWKLPAGVGFGDAVAVAGKLEKLQIVDFTFDPDNRYTFWSGMLGGVFLFLSYFGTDQSQVQRYLSGKSLTESRLGLLFNGIIKVPMQFLVLFCGILVFVFFQFTKPPLHFNQTNVLALEKAGYEPRLDSLTLEYDRVFESKKAALTGLIGAMRSGDEAAIASGKATVQAFQEQDAALREEVKSMAKELKLETKDEDYVFITYVTRYMPIGIIGLLLAVIFSAAMSSISSELNALATTSVIDLYKRLLKRNATDRHYLNASKWLTLLWGVVAITFALTASIFDNLIEAVNIIGSVFYGTILGIFLTAFFLKNIRGNAVFIAAILAEAIVIAIFLMDRYEVIELAYLWLNLIGCLLVVMFAWVLEKMRM